MFKKAFWVPYDESWNYPTVLKAREAISKYCEVMDTPVLLIQMMKS